MQLDLTLDRHPKPHNLHCQMQPIFHISYICQGAISCNQEKYLSLILTSYQINDIKKWEYRNKKIRKQLKNSCGYRVNIRLSVGSSSWNKCMCTLSSSLCYDLNKFWFFRFSWFSALNSANLSLSAMLSSIFLYKYSLSTPIFVLTSSIPFSL